MNFTYKEQKDINLIYLLKSHTQRYLTPFNINYFFNFGFLAGICLLIQLITGIFLAMHYNTSSLLAFQSVEHIMRDVNNGWLIRYMHSNGASMFFMVLYIHMARGFYYNSFRFFMLNGWLSGILIFLLTMGTAFIGYVLPWGQMSFWGATVITNLVTAVPYIGTDIVHWLWGGFSVGASTLNRFYSLHYLLPFIITVVVLYHMYKIHEIGTSNPFPFSTRNYGAYKIPFYPYFLIKDFFGLMIFLLVFNYFISFDPNYLGHSDNYIKANPLVTPEHIVPEWYFLPYYAILRTIPDKLGGILMMFGSILIIALLPLFDYYINIIYNNNVLRHFYINSYKRQCFIFIFFISFVLLGWLGACPVEEPYTSYGTLLTVMYFCLSLLIVRRGSSFFDINSLIPVDPEEERRKQIIEDTEMELARPHFESDTYYEWEESNIHHSELYDALREDISDRYGEDFFLPDFYNSIFFSSVFTDYNIYQTFIEKQKIN